MATSNVQLQQITSQLTSLGFNTMRGDVNIQANLLKSQIRIQEMALCGADKSDIYFYSMNLEKLHNLQNRLSMLNSDEVTELLKQKIEILEQLTS
jgi:hypothetical protein